MATTGTLLANFQADTFANRPTASATNLGCYFYATDRHILYQNQSGSAWQQVTPPVELDQTITDAATITWDLALGSGHVTIAASRTMGAPTNLATGTFDLRIIQGGSGSFTISWNGVFKFASNTAPTLATTAGHYDLLTFKCDGTNLYEKSRSLNMQ